MRIAHLIEIYETAEHAAPSRIRAIGLGPIEGPDGHPYYLLEIDEPLRCGAEAITQILVRPRFPGDAIDCAISGACTVTIARVKPGVTLRTDCPYKFIDTVNWGVGKITQMTAPRSP